MKKRTIEIEDTLPDRIDGAIEDVKNTLLQFLQDNPDTDKTPDLSNDLDYSGTIHEIIDGSVPIYTYEIKYTMFLHGDIIEQAFDDAGLGSRDDKWPMGWEAAAIYCYIETQVNEWYHENAAEIFETWQAEQAAKTTEEP